MSVESSVSFGEQAVYEYEVLAGLRSAGSEAPVDYEHLSSYRPNEYWEWHNLPGALWNLAYIQRGRTADLSAAAAAQIKQVRVYQRLAADDMVKYRPKVADALFYLLYYYHSGMSVESSVSFGEQAVYEYEVLAGLRSAGSEAPVDYEHLSSYRPNEYWEWHNLPGALWNLAYIQRGRTADLSAAAAAQIKQVCVYQRLAADDMVKYRPKVADALFYLLYYYHSGMSVESSVSFGEQAVYEYELLAGLRTAGSTADVDYEKLDGFTPNPYWEWHSLTGALYVLAYALRSAGDPVAGSAVMKSRVRVAERLVNEDAMKWQKELDLAHKQAAAFQG